ncbi:MAG: hypothetical protein ACE15C_07405 [Phycisphaerae bacterium]
MLKAIASLGGGSVRQISGEHGPRDVALELLGEMARPPLHDLKVEFRGLRTARVYPEDLPNLPAGCQQILLGRYLPEGADQSGEVVVTGIRVGQPVRYAAKVSLKDAEQGNEFIPRLWARMHLDFLLAQGASQAIQDEIVALSEEYHIMTPYTSLLVLESDADRERFKVKRRFLMRDGEKFFQQGRDNANYELTQQQMKRAGTWRLGLRRAVLAQLGLLGRNTEVFQWASPSDLRTNLLFGGGFMYSGGKAGTWGGRDEARKHGEKLGSLGESYSALERDRGGWDGELAASDLKDDLAKTIAGPAEEAFGDATPAFEPPSDWGVNDPAPASTPAMATMPSMTERPPMNHTTDGRFMYDDTDSNEYHRKSASKLAYDGQVGDYYLGQRWQSGYDYAQWLGTLFPRVPTAAKEPPPLKQRWPAEARAISDSLMRKAQIAALKGGLAVEQQADSFDLQTNQLAGRSSTLWLVCPTGWLVRAGGDGQQTSVQWCDGKSRSIFLRGFLLGRRRTAVADDTANPPLGFGTYTFSSLERAYANHKVELKPQGDKQTLLVLTHPNAPRQETRILVDTDKAVVVSIEQVNDGKVVSTREFSDFVWAAGGWWAGRAESFDEKGRRTSVVTEKFAEATQDEFDRRTKDELADVAKVQFLAEPGKPSMPDPCRPRAQPTGCPKAVAAVDSGWTPLALCLKG